MRKGRVVLGNGRWCLPLSCERGEMCLDLMRLYLVNIAMPKCPSPVLDGIPLAALGLGTFQGHYVVLVLVKQFIDRVSCLLLRKMSPSNDVSFSQCQPSPRILQRLECG